MSILILGKGLAASTLVTSALFAGTHLPTPTPAPATSTAVACHPLWKQAPDALKADLKHLRSLPKGEQRRDARKQIRKDALAGKYGDKVQQVAKHRKEMRRAVRKQLPGDLRTDLKAARKLPADQRRDALVQIRKDALAGEYGEKVRAFVQKRQQQRENCREQRQERRS